MLRKLLLSMILAAININFENFITSTSNRKSICPDSKHIGCIILECTYGLSRQEKS